MITASESWPDTSLGIRLASVNMSSSSHGHLPTSYRYCGAKHPCSGQTVNNALPRITSVTEASHRDGNMRSSHRRTDTSRLNIAPPNSAKHFRPGHRAFGGQSSSLFMESTARQRMITDSLDHVDSRSSHRSNLHLVSMRSSLRSPIIPAARAAPRWDGPSISENDTSL